MVRVGLVVEKEEFEWFIALFVINCISSLKVTEEVRNEQAVCKVNLTLCSARAICEINSSFRINKTKVSA